MADPLAQALAAGNPAAFAKLYDRLATRLLRTARRMGCPAPEAADVFVRRKQKNADSTPGSAAPADADGPQTALKLKQLEGVWTVYSVGPNGNDDGGRPPDGTEPDLGNDDIGLTLQR